MTLTRTKQELRLKLLKLVDKSNGLADLAQDAVHLGDLELSRKLQKVATDTLDIVSELGTQMGLAPLTKGNDA